MESRFHDPNQDFFEQQLRKYPTDPRIAAEVWRQLTRTTFLSKDDLAIVPGDQENSPDGRSTFVSIPPEIQDRSNLFGRLWTGQPERDSLLEISAFLTDRLPYSECDCDDCLLFSPFSRRFQDLLERIRELRGYSLGSYGDLGPARPSSVLRRWASGDSEQALRDLRQDLNEANELLEVAESERESAYEQRNQAENDLHALRARNRDLKRELYLLRQTQVSPSGGAADAQNNKEPLSYATCLDVVNFARANLDFVEFADRPKLDLNRSHDAHAEELLKCLRGFEEWCVAQPRMGLDAWLMSAESEFQLGGRKRFAMAEGETVKKHKGARLFPVPRWADKHGYAPMEAHVKFGFSLRLYYGVYWRDQHPLIVVGYIGQHLDVASSN